MLTFVTDRQTRRDGSLEPDLLAGHRLAPLRIVTLDGVPITQVLPESPWTHGRLTDLVPGLLTMFGAQLEQGADAYLGSQWVGSTEV